MPTVPFCGYYRLRGVDHASTMEEFQCRRRLDCDWRTSGSLRSGLHEAVIQGPNTGIDITPRAGSGLLAGPRERTGDNAILVVLVPARNDDGVRTGQPCADNPCLKRTVNACVWN